MGGLVVGGPGGLWQADARVCDAVVAVSAGQARRAGAAAG